MKVTITKEVTSCMGCPHFHGSRNWLEGPPHQATEGFAAAWKAADKSVTAIIFNDWKKADEPTT